MSQLPATLSPTCSGQEPCSQGITPKVPWGMLIPNILSLGKFELYHEQFTFGRSPQCTVRAEERFITRGRIKGISILHFIITKKSSDIVVIRDVSRNGTWVNGNLIGKENEVILQDGDEISVAYTNYKIYLFKHFNQQNDNGLPEELHKRFAISRTLGHGAFGEVKLAYLKRGCEPYAIKKLVKGTVSSDKNNPHKVKNEIKILRSLSHPNIVAMKDVIECNDAYFIVLEYMKGGTLQERIQARSKMSEKEVKIIFYQIIKAVKYLHKYEITHRDLKPANVLLSSSDVETVAKVSDFGLSKITENDTLLVTACGTPFFVAPEIWAYQRLGKPYTKKVDVWSCGVVLYYMLTMKLPFTSKNIPTLCQLIVRGKYSTSDQIWETISNEGKSALKEMLTVNPDKRASADKIKKHAWLHDDRIMRKKVKALTLNCDEVPDDPVEQPLKRSRMLNE